MTIFPFPKRDVESSLMLSEMKFGIQEKLAAFEKYGHSQDRNRVLHSYNLNNDLCVKLPNFSTLELKEAADSACELAFRALDRLEANLCQGWLDPACRQLPGFPHLQCTCVISSCTSIDIRSDGITSFQNCAWKFYNDEIRANRAPNPSVDFHRTYQQIYDDAKEKAKRQRLALNSHEAGTSQAVRVTRCESSRSGTGSMQRGSTSRETDTLSFPGPSLGAGVSDPDSSIPVIHNFHECYVCRRHYATKQILKDHLKSHETDLKCSICPSTFSNLGNLNLHMRRTHLIEPGSSSNPIDIQEGPSDTYECNVCGKQYGSRSGYYDHKKTHKEDARCSVCGKNYSSKANWKKHMKDTHPEEFKVEEAQENARRLAEKPHECEICKARFTSRKTLRAHLPVHRGETYCQQCNRTFPRKAALAMHNRKEHT